MGMGFMIPTLTLDRGMEFLRQIRGEQMPEVFRVHDQSGRAYSYLNMAQEYRSWYVSHSVRVDENDDEQCTLIEKRVSGLISQELLERSIPIVSGKIYFMEWVMLGQTIFGKTFSIADNYDREWEDVPAATELQQSYEHWKKTLTSCSDTYKVIRVNTQWLAEHRIPTDPLDESKESFGSFSFETRDRNYDLQFFARTPVAAEWLLGRKIKVPYDTETINFLEQMVLGLLEPLQKNGFEIQINGQYSTWNGRAIDYYRTL